MLKLKKYMEKEIIFIFEKTTTVVDLTMTIIDIDSNFLGINWSRSYSILTMNAYVVLN